MKKLLSLLLITGIPLLAETPYDIFPDALSAESGITFTEKTFIDNSGTDLTAPLLSAGRYVAYCGRRECVATGTTPAALKPFTPLSSGSTDTVTLTADTTLSSADIGHIVIGADNITVTFDAPLSDKGYGHLQKIASVTDHARSTTYLFKAGDYHIGAFDVISTEPTQSTEPTRSTEPVTNTDSLKITTEGDVSLYIKDRFNIRKMQPPVSGQRSVAVNAGRSPKSLLVHTLGTVDIITDTDFEINAFLYGFDDIRLSSKRQSHYKGAIHSAKLLRIGLDNPLLSVSKTITYDDESLKDLYVFGDRFQALPDEPDPTINNSTLLGIDSNRNGVRDDVERLIIIEEAKNHHFPKTHTAISLQYAWAWQKMMESPVLETRQYLEKASACKWYWFNKETKNIRGFLNRQKWRAAHPNRLGAKLQDQIFNTKERIQKRFKFNEASSGNIFDMADQTINACQINIDELGE